MNQNEENNKINEVPDKTSETEQNIQENTDEKSGSEESDSGNPSSQTKEPVLTESYEEEIKKLKDQIKEWTDKYIRLYSDFENYQKRVQKEKAEWIKYAGEDVIRHLLPVLDDFERAVRMNENVEDVKVLKEGFIMIHQKLNQYLLQKGLEPMQSKGCPFDADCMEAVTQIPAPDPDSKGKVLEELEKGYKLHDKLIRRAKVVVGG